MENFLSFQRDFPHGSIIKLEENFRSTSNIVDAANALIGKNSMQMAKTCFSRKNQKHPIFVKSHEDPIKEAEWIVAMIRILHEKHKVPYEEMAVIYRTNAQSRTMEEQLVRFQIPYQITGGINFYQREEIKDLLAFMNIVNNPMDKAAYSRVCKVFPGVGDAVKQAANNMVLNRGINYIEATEQILQSGNRSVAELWDLLFRMEQINKIAENRGVFSATALLEMVIEKTKYKEKLQEKAQADLRKYRQYCDKIENVDELLKLTEEYKTRFPNHMLDDFLSGISLLQEQTKTTATDTVKLMTVHVSKGLEFRAVFVTGLVEEVFPHKNSLIDPKQVEEERRLMYVALTRAKEMLILSRSESIMDWQGNVKRKRPSRFLSELPENFVKEI